MIHEVCCLLCIPVHCFGTVRRLDTWAFPKLSLMSHELQGLGPRPQVFRARAIVRSSDLACRRRCGGAFGNPLVREIADLQTPSRI